MFEQDTLYSPKVLVIPRKQWLHPNMTEKLFTGTLSKKREETKTMLVLLLCVSNVPVHENKALYTVNCRQAKIQANLCFRGCAVHTYEEH